MELVTDKNLISDLTSELAEVMNGKYATYRGERDFSIQAERDHAVVSVCVVLKNKQETFYYPVEARMDHKKEEVTPQEAALFLIDYIDLYFEEFFLESEGLYVHIDWAPYNYEAMDFELKGQILNRDADRKADEILELDELTRSTPQQ